MHSLIKIFACKVFRHNTATVLMHTILSKTRFFVPSRCISIPHRLSQFYIPLFVYVLIAIAVFIFLVFKVSEFSLSDALLISRRGSAPSTSTRRCSSGTIANGAAAMDGERMVERNTILVRLGIQFFVMPFFFLPDRCEWKQCSFVIVLIHAILAPRRGLFFCRFARYHLYPTLHCSPLQHIIHDQHIGQHCPRWNVHGDDFYLEAGIHHHCLCVVFQQASARGMLFKHLFFCSRSAIALSAITAHARHEIFPLKKLFSFLSQSLFPVHLQNSIHCRLLPR
jgi:hypothetical protein